MDKIKTIRFLLTFSIIVNVILGLLLFITCFNNYTYKPGILTKEIKVGIGLDDKHMNVFFTLPKGLVVLDFSPQDFFLQVSLNLHDLVSL